MRVGLLLKPGCPVVNEIERHEMFVTPLKIVIFPCPTSEVLTFFDCIQPLKSYNSVHFFDIICWTDIQFVVVKYNF